MAAQRLGNADTDNILHYPEIRVSRYFTTALRIAISLASTESQSVVGVKNKCTGIAERKCDFLQKTCDV